MAAGMLNNLPFAAGVGATLVAVHLLLVGGGRQVWPNRYLGLYFLMFAAQLYLLSILLAGSGLRLGPYRVALILAANPLVFLFFRSLRAGGAAAFTARDGAHFMPVLLVPVLNLAGYGDGLDMLLFCSMAGYGLVYLAALRRGPGQFPVAAGKAYRWLQAFALFYPFSALLDASIALELLGDGDLQHSHLLPVALLVVFAVSLVLVFGAMGQRPLFDWLRERSAARSRPAIPDDELDDLAARVRAGIADKRVYGNEDLTLTRFARQFGVPARQVSQAINRRLGMSFSDLLNEVRVNAAKRLLLHSDWHDRLVIDVAYEVGFRSKSNFHRAFRKITGVTPSEYRSRRSDELRKATQ